MALLRALEEVGAKLFLPRDQRSSPAHGVAVVFAGAAGVLLLTSLFSVWWTVEDWEREETLVNRGYAGQPVLTIGCTVLLLVLALTGAGTGRREWAPLVVCVAWALLLLGWFSSTGETIDSDATGSVGAGLPLGTAALILATLAFLLAARLRTVDRRRKETTR